MKATDYVVMVRFLYKYGETTTLCYGPTDSYTEAFNLASKYRTLHKLYDETIEAEVVVLRPFAATNLAK